MPEARFRCSLPEYSALALELIRWIPIGILAGSASALLVVSLSFATNVREHHPWLILLLAPAGGLVGLLYKHLGLRWKLATISSSSRPIIRAPPSLCG